MIPLWFKGLILLAALGALAGAVHSCAQVIHKARGYDAALERVAQVEKEKVDLAKSFAEASAADVAIAGEMAQLRADMGKRFGQFNQALSAKPLTLEVPRETSPDAVDPCRARNPARFRELFNQAVTGAP